MADARMTNTRAPWLRWIARHKGGLIVGLMLLISLFVRVRLRELPLERDEGEYAYAGQLMLQGVPPYKEAYNMKLPGTYAAYAVIMALFGQTPSGIHVGVALVNATSIVLMFLLGKKILDEVTGIVAAVSFGLLSLSPSVLGLAGHATHFVVLPALAGTLLLLGKAAGANQRVEENRKDAKIAERIVPDSQPSLVTPKSNAGGTFNFQLFGSGLLFGIAFLMKQHGVFFGIFGGVYLFWVHLSARLGQRQDPRRRRRHSRVSSRPQPFVGSKTNEGGSTLGSRPPSEHSTFDLRPSTFTLACFTAGFLLPYALTCLILWACGVFPQFWFWTVSYAGKYASAVPMVYGPDVLKTALDVVMGPNFLFWILAPAGAVWMWWDERLPGNCKFLIASFALCSFASVSVGFHYRNHYFITLLPALGLLTGLAVSQALRVLKQARTIELFLALPTALVLLAAVVWSLIGNGAVWFAMSRGSAEAQIYKTSAFTEAAGIADFLQKHTRKDTKVAVIGSEPEIFFLAHRRSVTGHIYTYALMEMQPYAAKMQEEMIAQVETNRPEYVVYVNDDLSWLRWPGSERKIFEWWKGYWATNLELVSSINIKERHVESLMDKTPELTEARNADGTQKCFLLLRRKDGEPGN